MSAEPSLSRVLLGPVAVNGFPARRLTKSNYEGGEWVTAYKAEQRSRLRTVFLSQHQSQERGWGSSGHLSPPSNTREASGMPRRVLDKRFLMRHCFVEQPTDLSDADISGVHLRTYKPEDFLEFDNLVQMNASDTALPMEAFKTFPVLEELELLTCGITDISLNMNDFNKLQFLDLSYNCVSGMAVLTLGVLPLLRELHLTGNNIVALPVEMSRPFRIHKNLSDMGSSLRMRFAALETLWLDDNKLTDQTTFSTLAGLRKLKYVNLDNNELCIVPQLRLIGTSPLKTPAESRRPSPHKTSLTPRHRVATLKGNQVSSGKRAASNESSKTSDIPSTTFAKHGTEKTVVIGPNQTGNDRAVASSKTENSSSVAQEQLVQERDRPERRKYEGASGEEATEEVEEKVKEDTLPALRGAETPASVSRLPTCMAPFPDLHTLSLANNLFLSSEDLLACGSWPSLKEIFIHGNPIVSMCKGMPPRLQIELVQKCNINIVRHKLRARVPFRIGKKAKEFKKVPSEVALIPRQTQLALPPLEGPLMITCPPSPSTPSPISHPPLNTEELLSVGGADSEDGVFITQGMGEQDDLPPQGAVTGGGRGDRGEGRNIQREMREWKRGLRKKYMYADVPEHYRGYEALLEEDTVPTAPIPTDLYGCIHALRYALKHTSPAPKTSSIHTHTDHQTKCLQLASSCETSTHRKVLGMHTALNDVRNSTAILEANLAELLQMDTSRHNTSKKSRELQKEGRHLLKQLQTKYDDMQTHLSTPEHNHTH